MTVLCVFPDGRTYRARTTKTVGPAPFPRRRFKQLIKGLVRDEPWTPPKRYDGSGGGAELYPRGQCTWYVARRRPDLPYFAGAAGDARNWLTSAQVRHLPTGLQPAVGAVAVFQPGQYGAGYYGHVAYVEAVAGAQMTVTEANFEGRQPGTERTTPWAGVRFIYRESLPPPLAPVVAPPTTPPPTIVTKPPPVWPVVDLLTSGDVHLLGPAIGDAAGSAVAGVGDVNGDGLGDFAVGAPYAAPAGRRQAGSVFVVFGSRTRSGTSSLGTLGPGGFRIDGPTDTGGDTTGTWAGSSISGAGDINGDGRADLIVSAAGADPNSRLDSGSVYVVFGKPDDGTIDLQTLGSHGYRIDGATSTAGTGRAVAGLGDVNGDGRPEVLIGAPWSSNTTRVQSGSVYVVFGKADTAPIDLAALGAQGYRIDGPDADSNFGMAVANAGDVNADGRPDVAIGAPFTRPGTGNTVGAAFIVFGKADTSTIDVESDDSHVSRFDGLNSGDDFGTSVAGAGDVNRDGLADVLIGAPGASNNARGRSGSTYVIFGQRRAFFARLDHLGVGGYRIDGADTGESGSSVANAGDVNGDGRPDALIGAYYQDASGREAAGEAYVAFGQDGGRDIDLAHLGADGFGILGAHDWDWTGRDVAGAGDVNGDGYADLIIGASASVCSGGRTSRFTRARLTCSTDTHRRAKRRSAHVRQTLSDLLDQLGIAQVGLKFSW